MSPAVASDASVYIAKPSDALANSPIVKAVTLSKGPVGYWRLNDTGGVAADSTGNGHNGAVQAGVTPGAPGLLPGDPNDASMSFDGINGYIDIPYSAALNPAVFSVAAWVMVSAYPGIGNAAIIDERLGTTGPTASGFAFGMTLNGQPIVLLNAPNQTQFQLFTTPAVSKNVPHLLGCTFDGVSASVWVDGVLGAGPTAVGFAFGINPSRDTSIARNWVGGQARFGAVIKDCLLVARVLSAADWSDLYLVGKNALGASAVAADATV